MNMIWPPAAIFLQNSTETGKTLTIFIPYLNCTALAGCILRLTNEGINKVNVQTINVPTTTSNTSHHIILTGTTSI